MPATAQKAPTRRTRSSAVRTAKIRARCASASPRIGYKKVAEVAGVAYGTVKNVLSDGALWDVTGTLDKIEAAMDKIESAPSPEASPEVQA